MQYHYETKGTCSRAIDIDLDDATGTIRSVRFTGGCNGNTKGLTALVEGQKATPHQLPRLAGGSPHRGAGAALREYHREKGRNTA